MKRPSKEKAEAAIGKFLDDNVENGAPFKLIEDGDHCWAFWIEEGDTTSYLHPDMDIEWYGTKYPQTGDEAVAA